MNLDANAHPPQSDPHASHVNHGDHVRSLFVVYFWLMALLALTVLTAEKLNAGSWNIVIAMAIAVTKAAMVVWIFMHVKHGGKLVWVFASAAFVWLFILFFITFADYGTRNTIPRGEQYLTHPTIERTASPSNDVKKSESRE